jgi:hypothetical protein
LYICQLLFENKSIYYKKFLMKRIIITEEKFNKVLRTIKEQEEQDYVTIDSEDFMRLATLSSFNLSALSRIKKFQGKPIVIFGNLDLSGTDTNSLGNIIEVTGNLDLSKLDISSLGNLRKVGGTLDISNTKIKSLEGVQYKSLRTYGSSLEKIEIARQEREKRLEAEERRQNNEWDLNNEYIDEVGLKAHALFDYLVYQGQIDEISDEDRERLNSLNTELDELNIRYDQAEDAQEINSLFDRITDIELEIEEIIERNGDVYDIIPKRYTHYGLTTFEVVGLSRDIEYAVGDESETEDAALRYAKSFIDDVGIEGFRPGYIGEYVDGDEVAEYFEDMYRDMIYDSPESYFDEDELGLSEEDQERQDVLQDKIWEYEDQLKNWEGEHDDEYYEIQELIDELQEELDSIEPLGTPTDDMVEEKLEEILRDIRRNPVSYLKDYGYEMKNFVDLDKLAQGMVDDDGYGIISSYDGSYDTESVNGETYYIFRIN